MSCGRSRFQASCFSMCHHMLRSMHATLHVMCRLGLAAAAAAATAAAAVRWERMRESDIKFQLCQVTTLEGQQSQRAL